MVEHWLQLGLSAPWERFREALETSLPGRLVESCGKVCSCQQRGDSSDLKPAVFELLTEVRTFLCLLNRGWVTHGYYEGLVDTFSFGKLPGQYVRLVPAIWVSNDVDEVAELTKTLATNFWQVLADEGIRVNDYQSVGDVPLWAGRRLSSPHVHPTSSQRPGRAASLSAQRSCPMRVDAIRTHKITGTDRDPRAILDRYLATLEERSGLAVISKVVSICQGRTVRLADADKLALIQEGADYYLSPNENRYHVAPTMKDRALIPNAGIDESNGDGNTMLWPREPHRVAKEARAYLRRRFQVAEAGATHGD